MSGGLIRHLDLEGREAAESAASLGAWRQQGASCPWCGSLLDTGPVADGAQQGGDERRTLLDAMQALSMRFRNDPIPWLVAVLLVSNPAATDRDLEMHTGICKTKINEARRRLRVLAPGLEDYAPADHFIAGQIRRRENEGTARPPPPPLVGTFWGRVRNRSAQRHRSFLPDVTISRNNTRKLTDALACAPGASPACL